jgi:hypothetical protein
MKMVTESWRCFIRVLRSATRGSAIAPLPLSSTSSETSRESDLEKLRREIENLGVYDLHDLLRQQNRIEWCEWHLNIDENDNAIKIAKNFHQDFKKLKSSSSIIDQIDTIEETFLKFMPIDNDWNGIRSYFKQAQKDDDPLLIIKAYTLAQQLSRRINTHSAVNTYHTLKLYCTLLNCPILAQTQEYTEAITRILFHPKLDNRLVRRGTVYRGIALEDKKLVANYKEGATIITTTFLSTSPNPRVAECFNETFHENAISIFCIYNINNTTRHTALNVTDLSVYTDEEEILILRYVPFTIRSVKRMADGRRMEICFDECEDKE